MNDFHKWSVKELRRQRKKLRRERKKYKRFTAFWRDANERLEGRKGK